ncbi:hypothetical protein BB559_004556 [Furculomyces boomerangus]|uniref:Mif2/CENP-C cupin domain-containing protein n=1 Tax=Furculomyces boomerangus TaxID=61424 RepID=A0A2T9YE66_9FUNG|nr:hypothetical protein BB559_004556 [Furculomyces boomerangus]
MGKKNKKRPVVNNDFFDLGIKGRKTGLEVQGDIQIDSDGFEDIDDFYSKITVKQPERRKSDIEAETKSAFELLSRIDSNLTTLSTSHFSRDENALSNEASDVDYNTEITNKNDQFEYDILSKENSTPRNSTLSSNLNKFDTSSKTNQNAKTNGASPTTKLPAKLSPNIQSKHNSNDNIEREKILLMSKRADRQSKKLPSIELISNSFTEKTSSNLNIKKSESLDEKHSETPLKNPCISNKLDKTDSPTQTNTDNNTKENAEPELKSIKKPKSLSFLDMWNKTTLVHNESEKENLNDEEPNNSSEPHSTTFVDTAILKSQETSIIQDTQPNKNDDIQENDNSITNEESSTSMDVVDSPSICEENTDSIHQNDENNTEMQEDNTATEGNSNLDNNQSDDGFIFEDDGYNSFQEDDNHESDQANNEEQPSDNGVENTEVISLKDMSDNIPEDVVDNKQNKASKKAKPKAVKTKQENSEDEDTKETRRSQRTKLKPLDYWRNERVVYSLKVTESGTHVPSMTKIIRNEKEPDKKPVRKTRKRVTMPRPKRGKQKRNSRNKDSDIDEYSGSDDEAKKQSVDYLLDAELDQKDYIAEIDVVDHSNKKTMKRTCALSALAVRKRLKPIKAVDTKGEPFYTANIFSDENLETNTQLYSGLIELPPNCTKPKRNTKDSCIVFYVSHGTVEVTIHDSILSLDAGSQICVPRNNIYSFYNPGPATVRLFFANSSLRK